MAQLRDKRTSELIGEGTPAEVVALADELGRDEVLFDDVGENFDPDAVRAAHEQDAAGLEGAAKDEKDRDAKARLQEAAKAARAELQPKKADVDRAKKRLREARKRVEG